MTDKFCPLMQGNECNNLCGFYSEDIGCCELIAMAKQVLDLDQTERKETFLALIAKGHRITIYEPVRENLGFEIGDLLRVTVHLEKKRCEIPPPRKRTSSPKIEAIAESDDIKEPAAEKPTEEEEKTELYKVIEKTELDSPFLNALEPLEGELIGQPIIEEKAEPEEPLIEEKLIVLPVEDVADEPHEEEPIEEVVDLPPTEEATIVTGADEETVVFDDDPEPEESVTAEITEPSVPDYTEELEEEVKPEYEYVAPCPSGLDFPLQDLEICRVWKCEHYTRKYGESPERCSWPGWLKVGWEDDVEEELVKDIVEEPTQEPEEPIEEAAETEDQIVMLYCESGAHKAETVPHRKKDLGHGWATYTCVVCNKETPMKISKAEPEDPF